MPLGAQRTRARRPVQRTSLDPWSGKSPHATEQLGLWAPDPVSPHACAPQQEGPPQLEKAHPATGTQRSQN
ncbi:unnamed protein product [Rangifer tarandus platyrhynchus]|uniref:Uncharacterized protein n=2 Tax=Rangifer tarandus platyrhynchus TaxID=3082113 RepID=A0ABN9A2M9_RANTA|nr:unnamed protein product [Rangifer tarandus platyrhynchus]CAI9714326.1 unnamed protein product [Rangifer tarandus platyrhynchus]